MTKVTRNVVKDVMRVQLSLRDEQQLSEHEDAVRKLKRKRNAIATQTQTQRRMRQISKELKQELRAAAESLRLK